jgi:comEA protein
MKPGYKTSEFWFTLVSFIFSGLFLLGIIGDYDQKEELISNVSHAVESVILIGGQLVILRKYLVARKQEKIEAEKRRQLELENQKKEIEDYVGVGKNLSTININTASLGELIQLPHIGPALAQNIIDYRSNHGEFTTIEQIAKVSGIGDLILDDIKSYITLKENHVNQRRNTESSRNNNDSNKRVSKRSKKNSSK